MRLFLFILLFPLWIFGQNNSVGGGDPFRPYRTTPVYNSARNTFTINTIPAAYTVATITNSREITIQNLTTSDLTITTSQGPQIVGRRGVITLANPNNTTTNQTVFTGNITVAFTGSVGGTYLGQNPTVIINQKAY